MKFKIQSNIKPILSLLLILTVGFAMGQTTVSPYSIYGPGEIQAKGFGASTGMGGAGIGLGSGNYLNNLNPASYAAMDSLRIIVEFGLEGKGYKMGTSDESLKGFEANLAYVAMGFRYTSWMAGSFGIVPFSSVGYSIDAINYVEGMNSTYVSNYVGSGGISQFYFSNSVLLWKRLSLGANASYMFGSLVQEENIEPTSIAPDVTVTRTDYLSSMYFDFGLQYKFATQKRDYSLGITYAYEQSFNSDHSVILYDYSGSVVNEEEDENDYLVVPETIGLGLGITAKNYTFALDYTFQKWSGVEYPIQSYEFQDSHKFNLGMELNPWDYRAINSFYKNWTYRFGAKYESSYLNFGGSSIKNRSFTLGVGVPMYGALSQMDFSITAGINGTKNNNLIQENYLIFNLGFSLNEIAFLKRKID
jgi:hypothetical protein